LALLPLVARGSIPGHDRHSDGGRDSGRPRHLDPADPVHRTRAVPSLSDPHRQAGRDLPGKRCGIGRRQCSHAMASRAIGCTPRFGAGRARAAAGGTEPNRIRGVIARWGSSIVVKTRDARTWASRSRTTSAFQPEQGAASPTWISEPTSAHGGERRIQPGS